jgi:hypothetical protein
MTGFSKITEKTSDGVLKNLQEFTTNNQIKVNGNKKLTKICLVCILILGLGGISIASTIFILKYFKMKKSLSEMKLQITELLKKRNINTSNHNHNHNPSMPLLLSSSLLCNNSKTIEIHTKVLSSSSSSSLIQLDDTNFDVVNKKMNLSMEDDDHSSISDDSDSFLYYETPCGSPINCRSRSQSSSLSSSSSIEIKTSSKKYVSFKDTTNDTTNEDDNFLLDIILSKTKQEKENFYNETKKNFKNEPNNLKILLNYIKSLYIIGECECDLELKKKYRIDAYKFAKVFFELNKQDSYLSNKWLAITIGRVVEYYSLNEKVKFGFEFKRLLDNAIEVNQNDYLLYYLRGRWTWKMFNLNWMETSAIKLLFGKLPEFKLEDAISDFNKVETLHSNKSKGNLLHLAIVSNLI